MNQRPGRPVFAEASSYAGRTTVGGGGAWASREVLDQPHFLIRAHTDKKM